MNPSSSDITNPNFRVTPGSNQWNVVLDGFSKGPPRWDFLKRFWPIAMGCSKLSSDSIRRAADQ